MGRDQFISKQKRFVRGDSKVILKHCKYFRENKAAALGDQQKWQVG